MTKNIKEPELLPCPFCGGVAYIEGSDNPSREQWYAIECLNCASTTKTDNKTLHEAITCWNKRKKP